MRWYNYSACFLAGVFLIHILPHVLNGWSVKNVVGVLVSAIGGGLLLWAGRFSVRNGWAILLVVLGMLAVLGFTVVHPHHSAQSAWKNDAVQVALVSRGGVRP